MVTVTVIGEAVVDLVRGPDGRYTAHPGGSPLNVAVALARLGERVDLRARFSGSSFGRLLRAHAAGNGVGLGGAVDAVEPASLAVVGLAADGSAEYDFYVEGTADWQWQPGELGGDLGGDLGGVVHAGSLACFLPPGAAAVEATLAAARRGGALVTFDPNVRPALLGTPEQAAATVARLCGLCHVVKASDQDIAWLHPGEPVESVARRWLAAGPDLVVVTSGADGAAAFTAGHTVHRPAPRVAVADTVGAGDAFMAALLAGLARRLAPGGGPALLAALLDTAIAVAALTCTRAGADPPTRAEVDDLLRRGPERPAAGTTADAAHQADADEQSRSPTGAA
ncbi:carbohydrate kinase [Dactylosporangium sp. AC04546]|uniref:carbohydrate kinase family protein n=1 Tax=Dactylosporangium sp. AC04546 TaxID=2862460 RepID=UPI001EDDE699|nr:carbohydrate kinase [Dactylosporangium sp. AC04546]WVK87096.1 carbohydrate kinase [Dactylosporangium sp. AC04546]